MSVLQALQMACSKVLADVPMVLNCHVGEAQLSSGRKLPTSQRDAE